jgi:hypothetical protein
MTGFNRPKTVEELREAIYMLASFHGGLSCVPYEECITPTHELFLNMAERILKLEKAVYGESE